DSDDFFKRESAQKKLNDSGPETLPFIANLLRQLRLKNEAREQEGQGQNYLDLLIRLGKAGTAIVDRHPDAPETKGYLSEVFKNPRLSNSFFSARGIDVTSHDKVIRAASNFVYSSQADAKDVLKLCKNLELYSEYLKQRGSNRKGAFDLAETLSMTSMAYDGLAHRDSKNVDQTLRGKSRKLFEEALAQPLEKLPLLNYNFKNAMDCYLADEKVDQKSLTNTLAKIEAASKDRLTTRDMDINHPSFTILYSLEYGKNHQKGSSKLQIDAAFSSVFRDIESAVDKLSSANDKLFYLERLLTVASRSGSPDEAERIARKREEARKYADDK
ncbi:MAG: hypothetical protein K2Z81_10215, partial [Cyanobacteria bacterium]|nr:hypothetical protein [Cyanobacteriota bacterium]